MVDPLRSPHPAPLFPSARRCSYISYSINNSFASQLMLRPLRVNIYWSLEHRHTGNVCCSLWHCTVFSCEACSQVNNANDKAHSLYAFFHCDMDAFSLMSLHGLCCCCSLFHLYCKMWFCSVCQLDTLCSVCLAQHINEQLVGGPTESRRGQGLEPPLVHVSTICGLDWPSLTLTFLIFFQQRSKPHGSQPELFPR